MKNIDNIIKYLSNEMSPDEGKKFRKEISENTDLLDEFEAVSSIWEEIRKQLELKESPGSTERKQLIAEILAEHDIQYYGTKAELKKEEDFKKKLKQSMIEAEKPLKAKKKRSPRIYSMVSLMAAAMVIALVIILNPAPDLNELTEAYYQPVSDPVFEKLRGTSRSDVGSAMAMFEQGKFEASSSIAYQEMSMYPDILEIQLLFALASYESGEFNEAESHLLLLTEGDNNETTKAANWYLSLLYIKTNDTGKAKPKLEILSYEANPYQKRASKLLKLMK